MPENTAAYTFTSGGGGDRRHFEFVLCSLTDVSGALGLSNSPEPQQSAGTKVGKEVYLSMVVAVSAQKLAVRPFPLHDDHASAGSRDLPTAMPRSGSWPLRR